jgi:hypothetical protein
LHTKKSQEKDAFVDWIRDYGVHRLVGELRCHQITVESWMRRRFIPNPEHLVELVRLSGGKISYADIIEPFVQRSRQTE